MSLYDHLEIKPCNLLGFLHFEVVSGYITIAAFRYLDDAMLFKEAVERREQPDEEYCKHNDSEHSVHYETAICDGCHKPRR